MAATLTAPLPKRFIDTPYLVRPPKSEELPFDDGEPMESHRHVRQSSLLDLPLQEAWKNRNDFFVGTNMFLYFSPNQVRNEDFRGPDFFAVLGVEKRERKCYMLWEEQNKGPNIVIDLLSPSTIDEDKIHKKLIYQNTLKVPEYFWFDPFEDDFAGFELIDGLYRPMKPDASGMFYSKQMGLALKRWTGVYVGYEANWLRWATPDGIVLPTPEEIAETQTRYAEQQTRFAEEQKRRADEQAQRVNEALSRIEELEALLKKHGLKS